MRQSPPTYHLHDTDQIECRHQLSPLETAGYPVLEISPKDQPSGRIEIYPTLGRLRRLHAVVGAYLAAHDVREPLCDCGNCEPGATPAARKPAHYLVCPSCEGDVQLSDGTSDYLCSSCDFIWEIHELVQGPPIVAEACCGAVVDADDLMHSMSFDFEPGREACDDPTDAEIAAGVRNAPRSGF